MYQPLWNCCLTDSSLHSSNISLLVILDIFIFLLPFAVSELIYLVTSVPTYEK